MKNKAQLDGLALTIMILVVAGFFLIMGVIMISNLNDTISDETLNETILSDSNDAQTLLYSPTDYSTSVYNQTWLEFDGVNDLVNTSDEGLFEGITNFTICSNVLKLDTGNQAIISDRFSTSDSNWTTFYFTSADILSIRQKNATTESGASGRALSNNTWYKVCGSLANGVAFITTNGYITSNVSVSDNNKINTFYPRIGTYYDGSQTYSLNGSIDYITIYNRSLTENEIACQGKGYYYIWNVSDVTNDITNFKSVNFTDILIENTTIGVSSIREIGNILTNPKGNGEDIMVFTTVQGTYAETNTNVSWANSSDGYTWVYQGNVNITKAGEDPYIIYNGSNYFLYAEDKNAVPFRNISLWVSEGNDLNGSWTEYGTIDKEGSDWEKDDVSSPAIIVEDGIWYMFYEGRNSANNNGEVGLATSTDGFTWTKDSNNPIVYRDLNFVINKAIVPDDIIKVDGTYYLSAHGGSFTNRFYSMIFTTTNLTNKSDYKIKEWSPVSYTDSMFYNLSGNLVIVSNYQQNDIYIGNMSNSVRTNCSAPTDSIILNFKLNENSGTTAYDSSGNGNNGTISGATWNNDGILNTLTNLVDYSISGSTFTILNDDYSWSQVILTYDFYGNIKSNVNQTLIGIASFSDFWEIIVLAIVITLIVSLLLIAFNAKKER